MKRTLLAAAMSAALFSGAALADHNAIAFEKQWTYNHAANPGQISEIPAFDHKTNTLWVAGVVGVDVLDADTGALIEHIDTTAHGPINSVAIRHGLAAFAIEAKDDRRNPGKVVFYDTKTRQPQGEVEVGALPDMLTFTHDGGKLLVANEGTPNAVADQPYVAPDPAGSVSIIDMATRTVTTAGFIGVPVNGTHARLNTGMDFEPEYIAIDPRDDRAYVTLQEANAVAVLDLETNEFTEVIGLGVKDFSLSDNGFGGNNFIDPTDKDGKKELRPVAVKGFYQPDAIAVHHFRGEAYLVMANEGDTREDDGDKKRAKDIGVKGDLERLNISTIESASTDLYTFGGRSFSIRDTAGNLVYDSGSLLDAEAIRRGIYDDNRSDDKGVEPEGVALLDIAGRTYAFIGLERTTKAAVAVFDITNPRRVAFIDMIVTDGDLSPEGMVAYHHRGNFYLAIANEVSNTTTLYSLERRHTRQWR
jgi:hypothetical protein